MSSAHAAGLPDLTVYEIEHLPEHLAAAGKLSALHRLVTMDFAPLVTNASGMFRLAHRMRRPRNRSVQNSWFTAKVARGLGHGYLTDIRLAWQAADERFLNESCNFVVGVAQQLLYALISGSVTSGASRIPPALLGALVRDNSSYIKEALGTARQISLPSNRAEAMCAIAAYADAGTQEAIIAEILAFEWGADHDQLEAEAMLLPYLPAATRQRFVDAILDRAHHYAYHVGRAGVYAALGPYMSLAQFRRALASIASLNDEARRLALTRLAPHIPSVLLRDALRMVRIWRLMDWDECDTLASLLPFVTKEVLAELRDRLQHTNELSERPLVILLPWLPGVERRSAIEHLLSHLRTAHWDRNRARFLVRLAPHVSSRLRKQLIDRELSEARGYLHSWEIADVLETVWPVLSSNQRRTARRLTTRVKAGDGRVKARVAVASTLSRQQLLALLKDCRLIGNYYERGDTLAKLFCSIPFAVQADLVLDWLEVVEELAPEYMRHWRTICAVLSPASAVKLQRAFANVHDRESCAAPYARLLVDVRTGLQESATRRVLKAADTLPLELAELAHAVFEGATSSPNLDRLLESRQVLFTVAPYLAPEVRRNAIDSTMRSMESTSYAPSAWTELYARLGSIEPELIAKGFQRAKTFEPPERLAFIAAVAPFILTQHLPAAVELAHGLPESYRLDAYLALATASDVGRGRFAGEVDRLYGGRTSIFSDHRRLLHARALLPTARWNVLVEQEVEHAISKLPSLIAADGLVALLPHLSEEWATRARTALQRFISTAVEAPGPAAHGHDILVLVQATEVLAGMFPLCDAPTRATLVRQAEQLASELSPQSTGPLSFPSDRACALAYLSACIDTQRRSSELARLALRLMEEQRPYGWSESQQHATAVKTIVRVVSPEALLDFVRIGLRSTYLELRISIFEAVTSRLLQRPPHDVKKLWSQILVLVASSPRADVLSYLAALRPVLGHMNGMAALEECFVAFSKVVRWWP